MVTGVVKRTWQECVRRSKDLPALLAISDELNFVKIVNKHTNCDGAISENAMQKWFRKSTLNILWKFPHELSCQNFLNHHT